MRICALPKGAADTAPFCSEPPVWIVEANQAKARKIATGKTFGNRIVVAEGLKGGEKVIVDGWQKVGEGTAVAIR